MTPPTARYIVTERAGTHVAGRRVAPGQVLDLAAAEAEHDLRLGTLVPEGGQLSPAFQASDKAAALRAAAAAFRTAGEAAAPAPAVTVEAAKPAPRRAERGSKG